MANNRYYLYCPICKSALFMGSSFADGVTSWIADTDEEQSEFLEEIYSWMWEHILDCRHDFMFKGEIFKVLTEYDKRIKDKNIDKRHKNR